MGNRVRMKEVRKFADLFAAHIVIYFIDARYVRPEIELILEILHEHAADEADRDLDKIFKMIARGQLNPQIMAIIDHFIDLLRQTDVQATLAGRSGEINRNRHTDLRGEFLSAFLIDPYRDIVTPSFLKGK